MESEKTVEQQLAEETQKRQEAEQRLHEVEQETAFEALAEQRAGQIVGKVRQYADGVKGRLAALVDKKVQAAVPQMLREVVVTPPLAWPEKSRQGNLKQTDKQMLDVIMGLKAMDSGAAGSGSEWVPTELGEELVNLVELDNLLRQFIQVIPMPSETYDVPLVTAHGTVYYKGENSAPAASGPGTSKMTLAAKKFIGYYELSYELEESSVIPVIDVLKRDMAKQIANAEERAIIWGDDTTTAASNIDTNVTSGDPQLAFDGLWYTAKNGTATWWTAYATDWPTSIRALRSAMDKYAKSPSECLLVCPIYVYNKLVTDDGFLTTDKVGNWAAALTGLLPKASPGAFQWGFFDGMPVACSEYVYKHDANGIRTTTEASNIKYGCLLVNRGRVFLGQRKGIAAEMDQDITAQTRKLVLSERVALGLPDGGTAGAYGAVYNGS